MTIEELLDFAVKNKASDLHLSSGLPPIFRVDGELCQFDFPQQKSVNEKSHAQ